MRRKVLVLILLCLMTTLYVRADGGRLYTADMLSSSTTSFVTQDHYGYIWVGTQFGLNKFDGYSSTHYYTDEDTNKKLFRLVDLQRFFFLLSLH